jgi:hypothetical protein
MQFHAGIRNLQFPYRTRIHADSEVLMDILVLSNPGQERLKSLSHSDIAQKNGFSPFICFMSECRDSNPESPAPKAGMLAVTPHSDMASILPYFCVPDEWGLTVWLAGSFS